MLINGDARQIPLRDESVHCVVTSPPYWGLRNYGVDDQIGREASQELFVQELVAVFREIWRVLHPSGCVWLNLGDTYVDKHLCGIPWRVALALQTDGWLLRQDVVWHKPNAMPESPNGWRWERHQILTSKLDRGESGQYLHDAYGKPMAARDGRDFKDQSEKYTDCPGCSKCEAHDGYILRRGAWRPTTSHEYVFMLAKSSLYFCDREAVAEPTARPGDVQTFGGAKSRGNDDPRNGGRSDACAMWGKDIATGETRNKRSVWEIPTAGWPGAHFATFPPDLVEVCVLAGSSERGVCAACGFPWIRVIDKSQPVALPDNPNEALPYDAGSGHKHGVNSSTLHKVRIMTTRDWWPSCDCNAGEPIPAVVLDPFAGSGTTVQVARQLGRHGVGLDLSFDYLQTQAKTRLGLDLLESFVQGKGLPVAQGAKRVRSVNQAQMELI